MSPQPMNPRASSGFSAIEVMVGVVIGMVASIVILQVFALSEAQKRAVTGGGDSQTNGAIALQMLQRDIRQSSYGLPYALIGCNLILRPGVTLNVLAPTTINHASIPAGDANTDTILVAYGSGNGSPEGDSIRAKQAPTQPDNVYTMETPSMQVKGDRVVAVPPAIPNPCTLDLVLDQVVDSDPAASPALADGEHLVSPAGSPLAKVRVKVATGAAGVILGRLFSFGRSPTVRAYAVRGGNLTACDYLQSDCGDATEKDNPAVWVPVAGGVISLRAQYGRDTLTTDPPAVQEPPQTAYRVDTYDAATPTTACGWARTPALRLALVTRSNQYEKPTVAGANTVHVTPAAPSWEGNANSPIDLSATHADWQDYRYKVFQTTIPIRNVAWLGVQSPCPP